MAARLLARADVEFVPMRPLMERATQLAIALDHPAYDCVYLALAEDRGCEFVTADVAFQRKALASELGSMVVVLRDVASRAPGDC